MTAVRAAATFRFDPPVLPLVRRRRAARRLHPKNTKVVTVDPRVLATALHLAHGDPSRVVLCPDGSAVVLNAPRSKR